MHPSTKLCAKVCHMKSKITSLSDLNTLHDYDPNAMSVEQARAFIQSFLNPITEQETVPLHAALQRTLAC